MQASIYRRNYYLIRNSSEDKILKDENRQRQIYTETARVINEMISNTKVLLFKLNTAREELEAAGVRSDEGSEPCESLQNLKEFQKNIPLTFYSLYPLDNKMVGPFVLRLTKQISYWRKDIPFLSFLLQQINQIFQQQKKNQTENISIIYFMTVKKIISDSQDFLKKITDKKGTEKSINTSEEQKQPTIFLVPSFRLSMNRQHEKKIKDAMQEKMKEMINGIYKGLDIASFEAVDNYVIDLNPEDNVERFSKKQIKRNKKIKKYVKAYKQEYKDFLQRKQKNQEKMRSKKQKLSLPKRQFSLKNSLQKNKAPNKSLSSKHGKFSFPVIKFQDRDADNPNMARKESNKENLLQKESQFSKQKAMLFTGKLRQARREIKLKL